MNKTFLSKFVTCLALSIACICPAIAVDQTIELPATAQSSDAIIKREDIRDLDIVVLHLSNGMKVALKKTASDEEITVRLTAVGGYSSLPDSQRASGQYASQVAIRSGFGDYHFDKLHALLYDRSIEFASEVRPFSRHIEGAAYEGEMETLMKLINLFFSQHNYNEQSFRKVMAKAKDQTKHKIKCVPKIEDAYVNLNNPNISSLNPVQVSDIDRADYQTSKKFFESGFSDPSEFITVIAGSFDMEKMVALVSRFLGSIEKPKVPEPIACKFPELPKKQRRIKTRVISSSRADIEAQTILTLPLDLDVDQESYNELESLSRIIYIRLKNVLRSRFGDNSFVLDVSIDLPYHPCLIYPQIKIQYFAEKKLVTPIVQTILAELNKMKKGSVKEEEMARMARKHKKSQNCHERDNYYWISLLHHYAANDWQFSKISKDLQPIEDKVKIEKWLRDYYSLDNYTIISLQH